MNKLLLAICVVTGFVALAQASPSIFKLPSSEDLEKLKEIWLGDSNENHSGQRRDNQHGQQHHSGSNSGHDGNSAVSAARNQLINFGTERINERRSHNHLSKESSEDFSGEEMPASVSNLKKEGNKFADQTLLKLKQKITENGLNQVVLPSETREFKKKFYGIIYHGKAELNHGYLKGFENIRRIGDASMHGHTNGSNSVTFEAEFTDMEVGYAFEVSFMGQKVPSQRVKGYLNSVTAEIEVLVDKSGKLLLTNFDITDAGHFKFQTTGLGSFNFLLDRIVDTIGNLTKRVILESMEGKLRLLLNSILNDTVYPVNALFESVQKELYTKFDNTMSRIHG